MGAERSNGEYLIFLNNDTFQEPNWIEPLIKKIESNLQISSIQPKILNAKQKDQFDYAGGSGGFLDKYGFPFARGRIFNTVEKDEQQYNDDCEIFWASGTCFLTRKSIFIKLGGFDEILFAHFEEIDFHWKSKLAGYTIWVEPKSVIYHTGGATLPYKSPKKTYLNHRNSFVLMLTNTTLSELIKNIVPRIIFEKISFIKELLTGNFSHAWAHVKAGFWILLNILYILKKRQSTQLLATTIISKKFYPKSIVLKYFLFNKKKYSSL